MLEAAGEAEADRIDNVGELVSTAVQYEENADEPSLSEFLLLCGFSSIHYFSRTFHRYVGKSPSEIRDRDRTLLDKDIRLHGTFHYRYYTSMDEPDQK